MKIGIIGATGMVGHVLLRELQKQNVDVIGIGRRNIEKEIVNFDLFSEWEQAKEFLQNEKFDIIINCSAILVNESNVNRKQAAYINSYLPHLLVDTFASSNTKLIHLSTGGVFSGKDECYFEDSSLSPETHYGITKAAGEFLNEKDLVVRSDFWGPDNKTNGTGLFNWFLNQDGAISAYTNVFFNGISNIEFARIVLNLINDSGIVHIGTSEKVSKKVFLEKAKSIFMLDDITLLENDAISKSIFLKSKKELPKINDLDTMLQEVYQYLQANRQYYEAVYPQIYQGSR
jgi:dTDP-4-dehydrorhamnose reductase